MQMSEGRQSVTQWGNRGCTHTRAAHTDTHVLTAVCHIYFYRGRVHDEITHQALGPVFIMYDRVYPLGVWCPGWGKPEIQGETERLSAVDQRVGGAGGSAAWQKACSDPGSCAPWAPTPVC